MLNEELDSSADDAESEEGGLQQVSGDKDDLR
jgi:hypothetical protein